MRCIVIQSCMMAAVASFAGGFPLEKASCGVFSPDGRSVAFQQEQDGRLAVGVLRLDTGRVEWIEKGPGNAFHPAWTPDGGLVYACGHLTLSAYEARKRNSDEGYNIRLWKNGVKKDLTHGRWRDSTPSVSPDGRTVWFATTRGAARPGLCVQGNNYMYSCPIEGGEATLRRTSPGERSGGGVSQPVQSPDGRFLAWAEVDVCGDVWHIMCARVEDLDRACRLTTTKMPSYAPRWSPDGRRIVFTGCKAGDPGWCVYVMDVYAGTIGRVCEGREGAFSPDGRQIVYETTQGSLVLRPFEADKVPWEPLEEESPFRDVSAEKVLWSAENVKPGGPAQPLPEGFNTSAKTLFVRARIAAGNRKIGFEHIFCGSFKEHSHAFQLYFEGKGFPYWATRHSDGTFAGVSVKQLPKDFEGTMTGVRHGDMCIIKVDGQPAAMSLAPNGLMQCLGPRTFTVGPVGGEGAASRPFKGRIDKLEIGVGWPSNLPLPPTRKEFFK